jgi:hypothetical protein
MAGAALMDGTGGAGTAFGLSMPSFAVNFIKGKTLLLEKASELGFQPK